MKNNFTALSIIFLTVAVCISPVNAGAPDLGTCLVDSLTGKERKHLAKWIYFAIAAHPEMSSYSNIKQNDRVKIDQYIGTLVTRLLAEDCASEFKSAQKANPIALQRAFELVGQVAMQELMTNQDVQASIVSYVKYTDQNKIQEVLAAP
ncbi:MAG: hypothetical protein R3261_13630 [Alphaproteobacteria bacterium]|nr:hypothetical protein [Alphaproteobacteria bacterium]